MKFEFTLDPSHKNHPIINFAIFRIIFTNILLFSLCVPANSNHSSPVNVDKCQSYEFCYDCSPGNAPGTARCSAGYSHNTVAQWKIAVIVLGAVFAVFMAICLVLYIKLRNKKKFRAASTPKPKEVTMEYNEMKDSPPTTK